MSFLYTPLNVFVPYQILRISLKPIIYSNTSPLSPLRLSYCTALELSVVLRWLPLLPYFAMGWCEHWSYLLLLHQKFLGAGSIPRHPLCFTTVFPGLKPSIQLVFDKHLLNWFWAWIQRHRISYTETNHLVDGTLFGSVLLHQWSKAFAANFSSKW